MNIEEFEELTTTKELIFNEEAHKYSEGKTLFTSVTTLIGKHFEEFNEEEVVNKLLKMPKYANSTKESILAEWKMNREYGSLVHKEIEEHLLGINSAMLPEAIKATNYVHNIINALTADYTKAGFKCRVKVLPELRLRNKYYKVAGTVDLIVIVEINGVVQEVVICDWKATKRIDMTSYYGKKGITNVTKDYDSCNFIKYSFQLNIYKYLLSKTTGISLNRISLILCHLKPDNVYPITPISLNSKTLKQLLMSNKEE